ncbi:MAG: hypothetical protein J2P45_14930, partial [Candidatus Dormibacteraeota bacterium]|nr:hypothetical protein [Candidatus Dormibacteraeota bacterium]
LFANGASADRAAGLLRQRNFGPREVRVRPPGSLRGHNEARAALVGIMAGGASGILVGGALGYLSTLASSRFGPVSAGLPLVLGVFILLGGAVGGTSGALFAVDASGDPDLYLTQEAEAGRGLVCMVVEQDRVAEASDALKRAGALEVLDLGHGESARGVLREAR